MREKRIERNNQDGVKSKMFDCMLVHVLWCSGCGCAVVVACVEVSANIYCRFHFTSNAVNFCKIMTAFISLSLYLPTGS